MPSHCLGQLFSNKGGCLCVEPMSQLSVDCVLKVSSPNFWLMLQFGESPIPVCLLTNEVCFSELPANKESDEVTGRNGEGVSSRGRKPIAGKAESNFVAS